jgi:transposase
VEQVQKDLNSWELGRVVWVMDRGMTSEDNRRILQKAGGQFILGEKLRGNHLNEEVLNRGGRFKVVNEKVHIKEVLIEEGSLNRRYVIVYNPQQAKHDRMVREQLLDRLECELEHLNARKSTKAKCNVLLHPSMKRYVKELKSGKIKINKTKVKQEEKLDGKYLLSTSDPSLSSEDIALGYKQLMEVERAFRTLKSTLSLRPMYHSKDDRIRSHVLICWLALLLVRIAETKTGSTWPRIRKQMQRIHLGEFLNKKNRVLRHTELTNDQRNLLTKLKIKPPKSVLSISLDP